MLTKAQIKDLVSLQTKKGRDRQLRFIVEGKKSILELTKSDFEVEEVYAVDLGWLNKSLSEVGVKISASDLRKISALTNPSDGIAVVRQKQRNIKELDLTIGLTLVLNDIQDPGNLGTIIRTADWFGVINIVCSNKCASYYAPKVIQATMGSFARVNMFYHELPEILDKAKIPIYGAFLDGEDYRETVLQTPSILIIGNEGHGIDKEVLKLITNKVSIPKIGNAESLNAAISTGILLASFCDKI